MEYHSFDDKQVASRIFEKGLEQFGDEIDCVLRHLFFLISVDDGNIFIERVITTFPPERARALWERWARYEYQYGDLESALKLEKRISEVYPNDPPIKRFAQRHIYLGIDAIAARDLGFSMAKRAGPSNPPGRSEASGSQAAPSGNRTAPPSKRPASPDYHRGGNTNGHSKDDYGAGHKRARGPLSPLRGDRDIPPPRDRSRDMRDRDRDNRDRDGGGRDRWSDSRNDSRNRRPSPPPPPGGWERDRDERDGSRGRGGGPPPSSIGGHRDGGRDDYAGRGAHGGPQIPPLVSWFVGELPPAQSFDGPVFKVDDLMKVFQQSVVPAPSAGPPGGARGVAAGGARNRSPATSHSSGGYQRGGGRPPPDYGPYQGPGAGGGRRRY
ncbi:hypothetical protein BKA70DRAFT_137594 [Coprinopsis sp. MPI-PUGE-AT-0042]|nr:hypothetical protein BKA70DRAFT_137594 [Coprinopsis sp. MPI-PUGE-AT-0042]